MLAAILFTIIISDIDEEVKNCILRCFADDTRVNKNIKTKADKKKNAGRPRHYIQMSRGQCNEVQRQ